MYEDDAAWSRGACCVAGRSRGNKVTCMEGKSAQTEGRLQARPVAGAAGAAPVGLRPLGSGTARDGYLYVPATYQAVRSAPLVVLLHGAGEDARDGLALLRQQADAIGLILLALSSRGPTWDLILRRGRYGPDVAAIDGALESTFSRYAVDPARVAVGGYSDGASYALSWGSPTGTCSPTCSGSRRGSWRLPLRWAPRASSSRTESAMAGFRSSGAAAGSSRS
jgi:hypothetical protein